MTHHPVVEVLNWFDSLFAVNGLYYAILFFALGACASAFFLLFMSRQIRESKQVERSILACREESRLSHRNNVYLQRSFIKLHSDPEYLKFLAGVVTSVKQAKSQDAVTKEV